MGILFAMVVGVLVGIGVGMILPRGADLFAMNILSGLVGGIIGLAMYYLILLETTTSAIFNPGAILFAALGALCTTLVFNSINVWVTHRNDG